MLAGSCFIRNQFARKRMNPLEQRVVLLGKLVMFLFIFAFQKGRISAKLFVELQYVGT